MGFKTISIADLPTLTDEEIAASIAKDKAAYQRELNAITDSRPLKRKAKRISARNDSCNQCVYKGYPPDEWICWYPHSDFYIEDLDIDVCYEGVLRFLNLQGNTNLDV